MPGLLADLLVALHLAFILFTVFGGLLWLRWRRVPWVHLPAAAWGVFVELTGRVCPLKPLENRGRREQERGDHHRRAAHPMHPHGDTPDAGEGDGATFAPRRIPERTEGAGNDG
jgi:hypothetical protein